MAKKRYCQKCKQPIEEGKEVKLSKGSNYSSSRYGSGPRDFTTYYWCFTCYEKYQTEAEKQKKETWRWAMWSLAGVLLVLIILIISFWLWLRKRDKKVERITKKELDK